MKPATSTLTSKIDARSGLWMGIATLVVAAYLTVGAVFGLDVCDSGFYMTFYARIFDAPGTVEYNFMYYLSGLVGGTLLHFFPGMGLLGMRLAGIVVVVGSMWLAFLYLRTLFRPSGVILALVVTAFSYILIPVTLCNDLLAIMLWVAAAVLLCQGLMRSNAWLVALSGLVMGVNIFTRVPDVLALGLVVLLPAVHGGRHRGRLMLAGLGGAVAGVGIMAALMWGLGHLGIFLDNMTDLHALATGQKGASTHSAAFLLMSQLGFFKTELWVGVKYGLVAWLYIKVGDWIELRPLRWLLRLTCIVLVVWLTLRINIVRPVWILAVAGCIYVIVMGNPQQRMAAWAGLYTALVFPVGSDGYAYNSGTLVTLLALPVAASLWIDNHGRDLLAVFALVCAFKLVSGDVYFDQGPVWEKTATVHNPRVAGIYTTPARAAVVDSMLRGIEPWVSAGDTLMVYGSMPLVNYMTDTRPYMGCSWPELLSAGLLRSKLDKAAAAGPLPAVLRQRFNTIGQHWGRPAPDLDHYNVRSPFLDDAKLAVLNAFLRRHHYRIAYSDPHFVLYLPPSWPRQKNNFNNPNPK